jgi:hypothetical protein
MLLSYFYPRPHQILSQVLMCIKWTLHYQLFTSQFTIDYSMHLCSSSITYWNSISGNCFEHQTPSCMIEAKDFWALSIYFESLLHHAAKCWDLLSPWHFQEELLPLQSNAGLTHLWHIICRIPSCKHLYQSDTEAVCITVSWYRKPFSIFCSWLKYFGV